MPYCSHCGQAVRDYDGFCAHCGAAQPGASKPRTRAAFDSVSPRTASILCYVPVVGWIVAILILAAQRFRHNQAVRFHAFQGLYLFVGWLINSWVIAPMTRFTPRLPLHSLIDLVLLGMAVFMMVKAAHEDEFALPIFGELARRSMDQH